MRPGWPIFNMVSHADFRGASMRGGIYLFTIRLLLKYTDKIINYRACSRSEFHQFLAKSVHLSKTETVGPQICLIDRIGTKNRVEIIACKILGIH